MRRSSVPAKIAISFIFIRDFPGGEGESKFVGRATPQDIQNREGREMYGLEMFSPGSEKGPQAEFVEKINQVLLQ